MAGPLTNTRWETFAQERASNKSLEDAATAAGYRNGSRQGHLLMKNDKVAARVAELQRPAAEKAMITIEQLFSKFTEQGTFDPAVFENVGSLTDLKNMVDEPTRRLLVQGWRYDKQGRFILELVKKDAALDRIARHLSFYNDTVKLDVGDYASRLANARAKADAAAKPDG